MSRPPRRWPLHPQPGPVEALSSWLDRLAQLYDLSVNDLLTRNVDLLDLTEPGDLDVDPPPGMAERTPASSSPSCAR